MYVPDQRERKRAEFPKDVEVYIKAKAENEWKRVCKCEFHNSSLSQRIYFDKQYEITAVRLLVISCWGADTLEEWQEYKEGYRKVSHLRRPGVRLAGMHLLCQEEAPHNNLRKSWQTVLLSCFQMAVCCPFPHKFFQAVP